MLLRQLLNWEHQGSNFNQVSFKGKLADNCNPYLQFPSFRASPTRVFTLDGRLLSRPPPSFTKRESIMNRHLVQNGLQSEELEILDGDRGILEVSLCFLQKVSTHGSAPF